MSKTWLTMQYMAAIMKLLVGFPNPDAYRTLRFIEPEPAIQPKDVLNFREENEATLFEKETSFRAEVTTRNLRHRHFETIYVT